MSRDCPNAPAGGGGSRACHKVLVLVDHYRESETSVDSLFLFICSATRKGTWPVNVQMLQLAVVTMPVARLNQKFQVFECSLYLIVD